MLTIKQLQKRLSEMSYKDWKISIYEGVFEGLHFEVNAEMVDNFNPGEPFKFHCVSALPPFLTMDQFDLWVSWRLRIIEVHESMEQLKVNGEALYNPHRENANRDLL